MKVIVCCLILCVVLGCDAAKPPTPAVDTAYPVAPQPVAEHRQHQHRTVQDVYRAFDHLMKRLDEWRDISTTP